MEADIASGFLAPTPMASGHGHKEARQLSGRYPPALGTRSLELLRVAAALHLEPKMFSGFDVSQGG